MLPVAVRPVYATLGDPGAAGPDAPRKRWLVACLWKRLQEDSQWRRFHEAAGLWTKFAVPLEALRA